METFGVIAREICALALVVCGSPEYFAHYGVPRNPVVDLIHKSGECLCGAFAKPNELREIEYWYPEVGKRIRDLEAKVRAAGFPWGCPCGGS